MAADLKKAKKQALMELIKHVNKKRFQDKPMNVKAEMKEAIKSKEEDTSKEKEVAEESSDDKDFEDYKRAYMTKSSKNKPSGASVAIVSAEKKIAPAKKGGKKRG